MAKYTLTFSAPDSTTAYEVRTTTPLILKPTRPVIVRIDYLYDHSLDPALVAFSLVQNTIELGVVSIAPLRASYTLAQVATTLVLDSYGTDSSENGSRLLFVMNDSNYATSLSGTLEVVEPAPIRSKYADGRGYFV